MSPELARASRRGFNPWRQDELQERQLDFQRVLGRVRGIGLDDERQVAETAQRGAVERHAAKRRCEGIGTRNCDPVEGHIVRRSDHHDPLEARRGVPQGGKRLCGDRTGVDIAGVRRDHGLGWRSPVIADGAHELPDLGAQPLRMGGIEASRHGGRPDFLR